MKNMPPHTPQDATSKHQVPLTPEEHLQLEIAKTRDKLIDRSVALTDYMDRSFRRTVDQTAQRMEQCAVQVGKTFESSLVSTGKSLESSAYAVGRDIERTVATVSQTVSDAGRRLANKMSLVPMVRKAPLQAFAGAVATGYVLSRMLSHRSPPMTRAYALPPPPPPKTPTVAHRQVSHMAPLALAPMAFKAAGLLFDYWRQHQRRRLH